MNKCREEFKKDTGKGVEITEPCHARTVTFVNPTYVLWLENKIADIPLSSKDEGPKNSAGYHLIDRLDNHVQYENNKGEMIRDDPDAASFPYEEGMAISYNDAKWILDSLLKKNRDE